MDSLPARTSNSTRDFDFCDAVHSDTQIGRPMFPWTERSTDRPTDTVGQQVSHGDGYIIDDGYGYAEQ